MKKIIGGAAWGLQGAGAVWEGCPEGDFRATGRDTKNRLGENPKEWWESASIYSWQVVARATHRHALEKYK